MRLAEERRARPTDDLSTNLVQAEVDGERLTSDDIGSFFILLSAAGNETTRNAISHGMVALTRYPEERHKWWSDFDGVAATAVEEIVRWASPIIFMRRNLIQDIEMHGIKMKAGDKVSMWYNSGNRDEAKFDNPWLFDVTRDPNPHIGFGAGGAHFCLGANLARREVRVLFEELHRQIPDVVAVEEPAILALGVRPRHQTVTGRLDTSGLSRRSPSNVPDVLVDGGGGDRIAMVTGHIDIPCRVQLGAREPQLRRYLVGCQNEVARSGWNTEADCGKGAICAVAEGVSVGLDKHRRTCVVGVVPD